MLIFITLILTVSVLKGQPYTCPGGETYDDSTLISCSEVVHGLPCTIDTTTDGTCTSFATTNAQSNNVLICCPDTTESTDEPETSVEADTTDVADETTVAVADTTECDTALSTCFSECNERSSSSSSRNLLGRYHSSGRCCTSCRSTWESCTGQTYSGNDNCGSSNHYHGSGHGHGHGNGCNDSHDEDAYAGGSAALSYFVIPLICIIFILCICCICCKRTNKNNVEEINMVSVVNNGEQNNKHHRVPSDSLNKNNNVTSVVGESHVTSIAV